MAPEEFRYQVTQAHAPEKLLYSMKCRMAKSALPRGPEELQKLPMTRRPKYILGINEGVNASIVISNDESVVFAMEEERITRNKCEMGFPTKSIAYAFEYLGIVADDIEAVCLCNELSPQGSRADFLRTYDHEFADRTEPASVRAERMVRNIIRPLIPSEILGNRRQRARDAQNQPITDALLALGLKDNKLVRTHHHLNHCASAYYGLCPEFQEPHLVLSLDGGGDDACSHIYLATNGAMELIASTPVGHSLGNIYSRITYMLGFTPHEHEYKLMGMAAYGDSNRGIAVKEKLQSYLGLDPANPVSFRRRVPEPTFQIGRRLMEDFRRVRFDTLASGLQAFTEDLLVDWIKSAIELTGVRRVLAAGGVFMNVKANKRIAELSCVEYFDVFPSCGDETLPFGANWHHVAKRKPATEWGARFDICAGPEIDVDIEEAKQRYADRVDFTRVDNPIETAANLIVQGHPIAWCQGKMEFGARALGRRSILALPNDLSVVDHINHLVKRRDFWMPFAPAVPQEQLADYAVLPSSLSRENSSPWMMMSFDTKDVGTALAAASHRRDKTVRAQTVSQSDNPEFHSLLKLIGKQTGHPVLLNTSFNLHGFPLAMGASDAVGILLDCGLEHLFINDIYVTKK